MQDFNWNDLKYLLALHRTGKLAEAARNTGVDETTVARRIKRLESTLGSALLIKHGLGRYELTDAASSIIPNIEQMETEDHNIRERLGQYLNMVVGTVRISSVPFITNQILIPSLKILNSKNPELAIQLIPDSRNLDLVKREADLAVRFSRPSEGGLNIKTKKLGDMSFGIFCSSKIPIKKEQALEWVGYEESHASLPQSQWIEKLRTRSGQCSSIIRLADLDSVYSAVLCGYGMSILPKRPCLKDERLRQVNIDERGLDMTRAVWLLFHANDTGRTSLTEAKSWLSDLVWT